MLRARGQKVELTGSLLASGSVSHFYFLLSCGERAGGRVRGRYPHIRQLCLFFRKRKKKPALGLKVKQGKTCKRSAVCWSLFSRFPVQGSHFVTQPWRSSLIQSLPLFFFSLSLFLFLSLTARGVSQPSLDFLPCRATSLEQRS